VEVSSVCAMSKSLLSAQKENNELNFLTRFLPAKELQVNKEKREVSFSFSSRRPVERWMWSDELPEGASSIFDEILSHESKNWDIERVKTGVCPFLKNHNRNEKLGQVKTVSFDGEQGVATVKLRQTKQADQLLLDIEDGTAGGISFGYIAKEYKVLSPAEYQEDKRGYPVLKKKAVLEAMKITLLEVSSEEIPADPTIGFGKKEDSKILLRTIELNGDPNFITKRNENKVDELEKALAELTQSNQKVNALTIEHTRATTQVNELTRQLGEKDAKISEQAGRLMTYEKRELITTKYYSLRSKAEELNSSAKLSKVEFDELFTESPSADIEIHLKSEEDKLGYISFHLGLLEKRTPLLNTQSSLAKEPIKTERQNMPERAVEDDDERAQRIFNLARSQPTSA
jgi:Caudovirus prohead serine protease